MKNGSRLSIGPTNSREVKISRKKQVKELAKLHKVALKVGSSHTWFLLQQAYDKRGLLSYTQMVDKVEGLINGVAKEDL